MELRHLRYFVAVAEEANFTRAAARLHLAQPGLSAQIRQFERELGQPLLDRGGRTVTLTEVGAAVLPHAKAALAAAQRIADTVDEFTGLLRGHVRVGLISGAAPEEFDVAAVLADFHDDHPKVAISLTEDTSERMLAALGRGELDIALVGLSGAELDPGLGKQVVLDTAVVAAVAADDRDHGASIPLAALRDQPVICLPTGTGLRGVFERACAAAGFEPRVAFEAAAPPLLLRLAARGLGVAVVPALTAAEAAAHGVRTLPIVEPELRGQLAIVWRTDHPAAPATKVLLGQLRIALGDRSGDRRQISEEY
ncbi:DNA-binding transcriptional regulator, LysR family [Nocardia amikacinitolerans]|uniref:DNA-binding transcriptional regulator, LysR family n=1 Tax=Nocardia amikacinitolerans TaxID=756689 RepID=A0A285M1J5_9NOCA|nr:LysR substrate-binding domain-containing protein [Nocardia amikacinitolerans]MCP2280584.1 DNA-binding transcriptional regulator, LysR family [Nocardia amikacinitolerans]MCP2299304.1 DNA-binding transcriptional regulator, LysR family [Nocardia amikacinitolerans]SNY89766.1 DNA-binding transcriptional regulator, LysR family [Nocardia amikacinitolerans]